jgi:ketosteroid isomerase-like protein
MSQHDVDTMRHAYEAFNRGDIPAVLGAFDAGIEWHEPGGGNAPKGTFRGSDRVGSDVFASVPQHFTAFAAAPEQFIDAGEHVVVTGRFRGTSKSGQALDTPFVHTWGMRNGKAVHFHNYVDQQAWTKAWGG